MSGSRCHFDMWKISCTKAASISATKQFASGGKGSGIDSLVKSAIDVLIPTNIRTGVGISMKYSRGSMAKLAIFAALLIMKAKFSKYTSPNAETARLRLYRAAKNMITNAALTWGDPTTQNLLPHRSHCYLTPHLAYLLLTQAKAPLCGAGLMC